MKTLIIETAIQVYPNIEQLSQEEKELLELARTSLEHSYSPYSNFKVGAAILLVNGKMMGGSNQENASYPLCLCAERVVISAADSQYPGIPIKTLAVTAKNPNMVINQPVSPCGACRQSILEVENKHAQKVKVILQGETGEIYILDSAKDLLPLSFDASYL